MKGRLIQVNTPAPSPDREPTQSAASIKGQEWYAEGLQFECTMCGACCTGDPGVVRFSEAEAKRIAHRLGVAVSEFIARFTHHIGGGRRSLNEVETEHGFDCVFLDRKSMPGKAVCSLYEDRPLQCRTFPWWPENLKSPRTWNGVAKSCEGVGRGSLVPISEIRIQRDLQRNEG